MAVCKLSLAYVVRGEDDTEPTTTVLQCLGDVGLGPRRVDRSEGRSLHVELIGAGRQPVPGQLLIRGPPLVLWRDGYRHFRTGASL